MPFRTCGNGHAPCDTHLSRASQAEKGVLQARILELEETARVLGAERAAVLQGLAGAHGELQLAKDAAAAQARKTQQVLEERMKQANDKVHEANQEALAAKVPGARPSPRGHHGAHHGAGMGGLEIVR